MSPRPSRKPALAQRCQRLWAGFAAVAAADINVPFWARVVGYMPLPAETYAVVFDRFEQRTVGTVFGGEARTDLTLDALIDVEQ